MNVSRGLRDCLKCATLIIRPQLHIHCNNRAWFLFITNMSVHDAIQHDINDEQTQVVLLLET